MVRVETLYRRLTSSTVRTGSVGLLDRLADRGEVLDVEPEVGPDARAVEDQRRGHLGRNPVIRKNRYSKG